MRYTWIMKKKEFVSSIYVCMYSWQGQGDVSVTNNYSLFYVKLSKFSIDFFKCSFMKFEEYE